MFVVLGGVLVGVGWVDWKIDCPAASTQTPTPQHNPHTHPDSTRHTPQRARIAESDNEYEKALRLYDRLTRVAPGYAYAWSNKGNAHIALGDLESGLDAYKRAIEVGGCRCVGVSMGYVQMIIPT